MRARSYSIACRTFETTSMGRLFDTVAALVGFTREQSFEGQAAMWLEHLARSSGDVSPYALRFERERFDFRPMLASMLADRRAGRAPCEIARAFHAAVANAVVDAANASAPIASSSPAESFRTRCSSISSSQRWATGSGLM